MNVNKAILIGNLTRDPELRATTGGTSVTSFSIATNRKYKQNGEKKEETDFHDIVVFGNTAESVVQYLKKGDNVYVEGRIKTRSWEGEDGVKKYRTEIVAESVVYGVRKQT